MRPPLERRYFLARQLTLKSHSTYYFILRESEFLSYLPEFLCQTLGPSARLSTHQYALLMGWLLEFKEAAGLRDGANTPSILCVGGVFTPSCGLRSVFAESHPFGSQATRILPAC